jgi:hypothetical protein
MASWGNSGCCSLVAEVSSLVRSTFSTVGKVSGSDIVLGSMKEAEERLD